MIDTLAGMTSLEMLPITEVAPLDPSSPPPYLGEAEIFIFQTLKTPKRRRDWLAGRLAAKRLLRGHLASRGASLELREIEIRSRDSGEPFVAVRGLRPELFPISISHSEHAAAAVLAHQGSRIGVDVETIAARPGSWLEMLAHPEERGRSLEASPVAQTALWTMKEAISKILGAGLRLDLWDIRSHWTDPDAECLNAASFQLRGKAGDIWADMGRPELFYSARIVENFNSVLTIAYAQNS